MQELRVYTSARASYAHALLATLGSNIKRLREAAGFKTARALAKELQVPESRLSDWENDRYAEIKTKNLLLIAAAVGASVEDLLRGVNPRYDLSRRRAAEGAQSAASVRRHRHDLEELTQAIAADEQMAADVRWFVSLEPAARRWLMSAPRELVAPAPPESPPGESTRERKLAGHTKSARGRRP